MIEYLIYQKTFTAELVFFCQDLSTMFVCASLHNISKLYRTNFSNILQHTEGHRYHYLNIYSDWEKEASFDLDRIARMLH